MVIGVHPIGVRQCAERCRGTGYVVVHVVLDLVEAAADLELVPVTGEPGERRAHLIARPVVPRLLEARTAEVHAAAGAPAPASVGRLVLVVGGVERRDVLLPVLVVTDLGLEDHVVAEQAVPVGAEVDATDLRVVAQVGLGHERRVDEVGRVEVARHRGRIPEHAGGHRVAGIDLPGELGGVVVTLPLAQQLVALHQVVVDVEDLVDHLLVEVVRVVGGEVPELVLDQLAAQGEADVVLLVDRLDVAAGLRHQGLGPGRVAGVVDEQVAAQRVAARLGDHVDHAAEGAAVLGLVAAGLDLDLVDEVERDAGPGPALGRVGGVELVDHVAVLERRGTHDRRVALEPIIGDGAAVDRAGGQERHRGEVPSGRQIGQQPLVELRADRGGGDVDDRRLAGDQHRVGEHRGHRHLQRHDLLQGDPEILARDRLEAVEDELGPVGSGWQEHEPELPVGVGLGHARPLQIRGREGDHHPRQHLGALCDYGALNAAAAGLSHCRSSREEAQGDSHDGPFGGSHAGIPPWLFVGFAARAGAPGIVLSSSRVTHPLAPPSRLTALLLALTAWHPPFSGCSRAPVVRHPGGQLVTYPVGRLADCLFV